MTKFLWRFHAWLGLFAGLGLLVIGVTGSILVFNEEVDALFAPKETRVQPTPEGRQSFDALLAGAQKSWPEYEIGSFGHRTRPDMADLVYLKEPGTGEYKVATLNQYTAQGQSKPFDSSETVTGILLELHYTWFAHHYGMLITGIFGALLCLLGVTGVWLYRGFWKSFFTLRWGKSARIFFSDLHKMVGISSVAFNLLLGFTGAYFNFAHIAVDGLSDHEEEKTPPGPHFSSKISIDAGAKAAAAALPGFETHWVTFPSNPKEDISLWGRMPGHTMFASNYGSLVTLDAQTGAVKTTSNLHDQNWWMRFADTFRSLHYGTFGGMPVKILWCLGGLAPGVLAVSGFMIWRARHKAKKKRAVNTPEMVAS